LAGDVPGSRVARLRQLSLTPDSGEVLVPQLREGGPTDEQEIYSEVIRKSYEHLGVQRVVLVSPARLRAESAEAELVRRWAATTPSLEPSTAAAFFARAYLEAPAPEGLDLGVPVSTIDPAELRRLRDELVGKKEDEAFWKMWGTRFPGASDWMELSPIGLNPARTQALVHTRRPSPYLYNDFRSGDLWLLERRSRGWTVVSRQ
jgi:hypothetical protein